MNRPTSVLVFAILNLILGGLGVLSLVGDLAMRLGLFELPTEGNPVLAAMATDSGLRLYLDVMQVIGIPATVVLIASAVGLLKLKPWARAVTIAYGVYTIAVSVFNPIVLYDRAFGPLLEQTAGTSGPERMAAVFGTVGLIVGAVVMTGYWVLVMVFMTRRHVVAAFDDPFGDAELAADNTPDRLSEQQE